MFALWSQDADGDVTHLAVSEDVRKLEARVKAYFEEMELGVFPGFTFYSSRTPDLLYTQAADVEWWIEPVEVL